MQRKGFVKFSLYDKALRESRKVELRVHSGEIFPIRRSTLHVSTPENEFLRGPLRGAELRWLRRPLGTISEASPMDVVIPAGFELDPVCFF